MRATLPKEPTRADDRKADRHEDAAAAEGGDSPAGGRFPSGGHGTKRAATATTERNPRRAALRRELDHWCACRRFVYQFGLMAKPKPTEKKRSTGRGGKGGWQPRMWRPRPITPRKLGLAAVKHQQAMAEHAAATEQRGRAFAALARVVAAATERPTISKPASQPHRPPTGGQNIGLCCEHCRNVFTPRELKAHYAVGCPALKAG